MTASSRLATVALALAGGIASPAMAAAQAPAIPADAPAADPPPADYGEIVVTAQRRSQLLRDVPISVTALSQETLVKTGINNTFDIQRVTPGVQLPLFGGFIQPVIRGIGSQNSGLGDSSNVAVYVDGIYQPSQSGQLLDLPDVQQIEVLKGPQGTLYGQNAAGGAITITSVLPSFEWGGRASASYGNYDDLAVRGYVTGPLVDDRVAISLAGAFQDRDGYKRNIGTGKHDSGLNSELVRARLRVKLGEESELVLGGYYSDREDGGIYAGRPIGPGTPTGYAFAAAAGRPLPRATRGHDYLVNGDTLTDIRSYGVNLLGRFGTPIGTFSTVTAYGNVDVHDLADPDYTGADVGRVDLTVKNHNFIQEVNFASEKMGDFTVSAGLFYLALKESYAPNSFFLNAFAPNFPPVAVFPNNGTPLFTIQQYAQNRKRSYAGYLEVSWDVTDRLNLTAGGRYSRETQRTADNRSVARGVVGKDLLPDPRGTVPFKKFTPRATLRYELTPTANVYASYSKGFKSGYVNSGDVNSNPIPAPVRPEVVDAYEIGFKGRIAEGVNLNVAAFRYDYKDIQVYVYGVPAERYLNAASGRINGVDGDISLNLAPGFIVTAGAAYLDAKYRDFPGAVVYNPNAATGYGYAYVQFDASGKRLLRTPRLSGNLAVNYEVETGAGTFGAYASTTYNSGINYDVAGIIRQGRYGLVDGQVSFEPKGLKGVRLVAFGRNLTDRLYIQSVLTSQFVQGASYADPRTYGVRAEFKF